jgi:hypothetical protein
MSKFLLNLLVQISKDLVYSKIKFYSEKNFPRHFQPVRLFGPAVAHSFFLSNRPLPLFPLGLGLTAGPAGPRVDDAPPNCHLPHRKTPPAAPPSPSLHAWLTDGPHLSSFTFGPPELGHAATTSRCSPRRPALPRMPPELLPPRHHFPLLNPQLLTSPPPSMALMPLTPPLHPRPPLSGAPPTPIKRR